MNKLNIDDLRSMSENKLIFTIDLHFKQLLHKVIVAAMEDFSGIPLEWEDFYYEFLSCVHEQFNNYDDQYSIATFLTSKCRFFVKNRAREFITNKHKLMNDYVEANDVFVLRDPKGVSVPLDLSMLNRKEMKVYELIILEEMQFIDAAKVLNISKWKLSNIYESVIRKLKPQVEKN